MRWRLAALMLLLAAAVPGATLCWSLGMTTAVCNEDTREHRNSIQFWNAS